MDAKLLERIVKCAVSYNGQKLEFDSKFLEYMDYLDLTITKEGNTYTLTTKMRKEK